MRRFLTLLIAVLLTACSAVPPAAPTPTARQESLPTRTPAAQPTPTATPSKQGASPSKQGAAPTEVPDTPAGPSASPTLPEPSATPVPSASPQNTPAATSTPAAPGAATAEAVTSPLSNASWEWVSSAGQNGAATQVTSPSHYMVLFGDGNKLSAQLDCAIAGGSYKLDGSNLQIQLQAADVSGCPYGSQAGQFQRELGQVTGYAVQDGTLVLSRPSGTLRFIPQALIAVQPPAAGAASAEMTAFALVHSGPGAEYPIYGALPAGAVSEISARNFQSGGWWGLKMPGYPDQMGWVDPRYVKASNADQTPYVHVDLLQVGGRVLLWPDISDSMASVIDPVPYLAGPGGPYPVLLMGLPGDTMYVVGRSADNAYLVVYLGADRVPGGLGWVAAKGLEARNVERVPVFHAPPLTSRYASYQPQAGQPVAAALTTINVRAGPDQSYDVLKTVDRGEILSINGQTADRLWWRVSVPKQLSQDGNGWVAQSVVRAIDADNVTSLVSPFPFPYARPDTASPACVVVKQTPYNGARLQRGTDFTINFTLLNNTDYEWSDDNIDLVYVDNIDNAPMHLDPSRLDLNDAAQPNATVTFSFKSQVPTKHTGLFGERWVLRRNGGTVCSFTYTITATD